MKNFEVQTTYHSFLRQERMVVCSLEKHRRYEERAWRNGKKVSDYAGKAFRYLSGLETKYGDNHVLRVFAGFCFIYTDSGTLITLYQANQKKLQNNRWKGPRFRGEDDYEGFASDYEEKIYIFYAKIG